MTYREIIADNIRHHTPVKMWPQYAYHYTDIQNIVSILSQGYLYSRTDATSRNVMRNDNASVQVINMTSTNVISDVRFYFRPLTPTQYHNEGFKHPDIRYDGDPNANVPVPVFLAFDLELLLLTPGVSFSETSLAGHGSRLCNTPEEFAHFNFDQIYKNGWMEDPVMEKRFRQAEIVVRHSFPIDRCLHAIFCRNEVEKITLLNLLRDRDIDAYARYKDFISVCRQNMFECNGLYISDCRHYGNVLIIHFSDPEGRRRYTNAHKKDGGALRPLTGTIDIEWKSASKKMLYRRSYRVAINYEGENRFQINLSVPPAGARCLYTRVTVEDRLLCYMSEQLSEAALL